MKKKTSPFLLIAVLVSLSSCTEKNKSLSNLDNCPIVAEKSGDLTTLNYASVKDTCQFPISALLSSFEIVRLENSEEALVGLTPCSAISENYIGLYTYNPSHYKLFNKDGKYIRNVSSEGQGPNEYLFLYDSFIDERNDKVYLLPYSATKLLVFDLNGNPGEHIPLPFMTPKGRFVVNEEKKELLMMVLPFPDTPYAIWKQDFQGNVLQSVDAKPFIPEYPDYNNEVEASLNVSQLDYSLFTWYPPMQDSIYHYNEHNNHLTPVFTVNWKGGDIIRHSNIELPGHYLVTIIKESNSPTYIHRRPKVLVDKQTLKGCFVDFKFDMLGNIDGPPEIMFIRGYCIASFFPHQIKEQLEQVLSNPKNIEPEMQDYLKKLNDSISEDDNNILFIGKLKTSE